MFSNVSTLVVTAMKAAGWGNGDELLKGVAAALPTLPPAWVAVAPSVATGMEGKGRLGAVAPLLA